MRRWVSVMVVVATIGCYDDHSRDRDAAPLEDAGTSEDAGTFEDAGTDAAARDDAGPRPFGERCEIAWVREVPVAKTSLGYVDDLVVVESEGEWRVLASYFLFSGDSLLGAFDAATGEGILTPGHFAALASSHGRVIGVDSDEVVVGRRQLIELDPRDGHTLRVLGEFYADSVSDLELVSSAARDVLSFSTFEAFGRTSLEPRARGTSVVLTHDSAGMHVLAADASLGALIDAPEGATLLAAPDTQLCFEGTCLGAPGNRHRIASDGTVHSRTDADRSFAARARAAAARRDGSWFELHRTLDHHDAEGRFLVDAAPPADFNVYELSLDPTDTRLVTHTRVRPGPARRITSDAWLPALDHPSDLYITWDADSLTPRHFFVGQRDGEARSGLHRVVLDARGRTYATGIADPVVEVCGRTFEHSIFVIAFE